MNNNTKVAIIIAAIFLLLITYFMINHNLEKKYAPAEKIEDYYQIPEEIENLNTFDNIELANERIANLYLNTFINLSLTDIDKAYKLVNKENDFLYSVGAYPTKIREEDLPKDYKDAVISVEDRRYYNHGPIDLIGISRALYTNLKNQQFLEGGSTIAQQVAKNLYFISPDENAAHRKVAEVFMASDLEKAYGKDTVLELYVNTIYFGDGYYTVKEASVGYFKKEPSEMSDFEATLLAGIPNAPSIYSPTKNLNLTLERQKQVLNQMVKYDFLTNEEAHKILDKRD